MQMNDDGESKDPEAAAIILKLKRKKGAEGDSGGDDEGSDSEEASESATLSASEDLFQAIRGRAPTEQEAAAVHAALQSYTEACGR